jgi:hypothetical protein
MHKEGVPMKSLLGILSLLSFGAALIAVLALLANLDEPLIPGLVVAILLGLAVALRGMRARMR